MILRLVFLLTSALFSGTFLYAQISGIINSYTPVTQFDCNAVKVVSTAGFAAGDRVLIIQMKGATIDVSNTTDFGNIINYGNCGKYEFATISAITGNTVMLQYNLVNSYTVSGAVQLIRVPQYTNVTVSSTLTAQPWNGSTGGVLVMEVSGTLTLNAPVSVDGLGFRGSNGCTNPDGSCGSGYPDYFYPVSSGFGAEKGEGIAFAPPGKDGGKGALGNGGGGGNKHNSGGGGGANASAGGNGGDQADFCSSAAVGGRGGKALDYTTGRIFMGGGGGSPDHNNGVGTDGTNGGGIIIIRATTLHANNTYIGSEGLDVGLIPNGIGDGAGGAGAGGTILLGVQTYTGTVAVHARGGKGGDQETTFPACFGPGGGGGAGMICVSGSTPPANISTITAPGSHGVQLYSGAPCFMGAFGASAGGPALPVIYNLSFTEGTVLSNILLDLGPDMLGCNASATFDTGYPGLPHHWSTGATGSSITVTSFGTYWVDITTSCNTTISDTITFGGIWTPVLNLGNDTATCISQARILDAKPGFEHYLWSDGSTFQTFTANGWGTYWVTATDSCGDMHSDTIVISEKSAPLLTLTDVVICKGKQSLLTGSPTSPFSAFEWSPAAGLSCTQCAAPLASPAHTTTYLLTAQTSEGCTATESVTVNVEENVPTGVSFATAEAGCTEGGKVQFGTVTGGSDQCYFNFNGLGLSTSAEYSGLGTGTYPVSIYNSLGSQCAYDTLVQITGEFNTLYIPNAFTPDEDNVNRNWKIEGNCLSTLQLTIFNRWGEIIATIDDLANHWDGTWNGLTVPDGIYVYTAIATFASGEIREVTGTIALLR